MKNRENRENRENRIKLKLVKIGKSRFQYQFDLA